MKLEMELKPGDVVLLKFLACLLIIFFSFRFFVFPGIEKHQDLVQVKEEKQIKKDEMVQTIKDRPANEEKIVKLNQKLAESGKGFYELLENQEVDELVTGLALKQRLKPVYLKIENTTPGIPAAYQTVVKSKDSDDTAGSDSHSGSSVLKYVNTTTVSITLQGSEQQIRAMLDDIARNYPGVQVRSFHMEESTYVDDSLQQVSQNNCECTMAVYTCGQLGK